MSDIDLDAIRARAEAATEGSWNYGGQGWVFAQALVPNDGRSRGMRDLLCTLPSDADGLFVAHSREDVPALLAEVERQRARADRAEATIARARETLDRLMLGTLAQAAADCIRAAIEGTDS